MTDFDQIKLKNTRSAFLWTNILRSPFWAIYNLLLFILYKDLHASPFQIALFIALKPVVSIFSLYWASWINKRPDRLISNITWAGFLGFAPFLLFPFFYGPWFVIFASALFMAMFRGVVPAWMEIFKLNLPGESKNHVFSWGSIVSYVVGALLPLAIGPLLDGYNLSWRWIFAGTAVLGIAGVVFQLRIPIEIKKIPPTKPISLVAPWKEAWHLFTTRKDFRYYQIGFMIFGGTGLMIMQPALPAFFIDVLGLSYTELSIALTLCKGIGFALTSPLWAKVMAKTEMFRFSSMITFFAALFPIILIMSQFHVTWVYVAYIAYGMMQAGSELNWHLSGPHFAKEEESTAFSRFNILMVGVRGCFIPQIGSLLILFAPSTVILLLGTLFCLAGTYWMLSPQTKKMNLLAE